MLERTGRVPRNRGPRPFLRPGLVAIVAAVGWMPAATVQQSSPVTTPPAVAALPDQAALDDLRAYIRRTWVVLTRTPADLVTAARDPKFPRSGADPHPVYVAPATILDDVARRVRDAVAPERRREIVLRPLPEPPDGITEHGLLYLPHPYVVPGGRFNEMYGWDSYFIQLGLLRDGQIDLARALVDNFIYQIEHYGTILNANRTYYLTRSQPPFLTRMILGVYERTGDRAWLERTWPAVVRHHGSWVTAPHLAGSTSLSRYFDRGEGPAPEVVADEKDAAGRTHYDRVRAWYATHEVTDYDLSQFYDRKTDHLTPLFYKGDRSMRESGFDPSNRFGPFSVDIIHYAAVCLNSLLHRMERDAAEIAGILARPDEQQRWAALATAREALMTRSLWDARAGMYFDYHVGRRTRRDYPFATTFYPLWTGAATREQARRVRDQLPRFERDGGLLTSTTISGSQWDAPFGWAPLQLIAAEGLRRYGFVEDADRISAKFIALVAKEYREHGTIVEKYDVQRRESDVAADISFGYAGNQAGFGWTNGVVLELLARMGQTGPPDETGRIDDHRAHR